MYYVFFHYPCNDGELARSIWEHFEPNSKFYKWEHSNHQNEINIINNLPDDSNIVFLDLTPHIEELSSKHNYIIIDHHMNAIQTLLDLKLDIPNYNIQLFGQKGFPEKNNLSGCMLVWGYFTKDKYPSVVFHVGNKDVWNFSDPNTEAYCIGFNYYLNNENNKILFMKNLLIYNKDDEIIQAGNYLINSYKEQAKTYFKDYKIDIFNYNNNNNINNINILDIRCSENILYKYLIEYTIDNFEDIDVLRILHTEKDNKKVYSLRSISDVDVSEIARYFGGNGHKKAAGYFISDIY
jgi:hypothetical protein